MGTLGAVTLFGARIPDATAGYLPPRGHISPAAWPMALGGAVFGLGMALSGSCISAHIYRLSEGSPLSPVALVFTLFGFASGDLFWNSLYLAIYRTAEPIWLPKFCGFGAAVILQLGLLAAIAYGLWRWQRRSAAAKDRQGAALPATEADLVHEHLFVRRWPWWVGGIVVGESPQPPCCAHSRSASRRSFRASVIRWQDR